MPEFLKNRWVLFAALLVFIVCKIPHLFFPYYWDESWPYVPAIFEMYKNGVSILPNAIDAELSRGHPLFFHAMGAIWMHIFGGSHLSLHSFALTISVLMFVAIYEAGLRMFNVRVAVMALLLVMTQEIIFVQSSFVLFEMQVAFLAFLSIWFYAKEKFLLTFVCLSLLFYTKESGLVAGAVLGLDAFMNLFNKSTELKKRLFRLAAVAGAFATIGIFFLLQKHIRGWYVFPLYTNTLQFNWDQFWWRFRMGSIRDTFDINSEYRIYLGLLLVALMAAVHNGKYKYLALFLPAIFIYYCVSNVRAESLGTGERAFVAFSLVYLFFIYVYSRPSFFAELAQRKFIILAGCFIICFLNFTALAYFSTRYLLAAIIPALFLAAVFYDMLFRKTYKWLYYVGLLLVVTTGYNSFKHSFGHGDTRLGAFTAMHMQQQVVDFMEHNNLYDKRVYSASFLTREHLGDPTTGFLHSSKLFVHLSPTLEENTQVAIFDNLEPDAEYARFQKDTGLHLMIRFQTDSIWSEIYRHGW